MTMTHAEIIAAINEGEKILIADSYESALDFEIEAIDPVECLGGDELAVRNWLSAHGFGDQYAETEIEVTDPRGYYSGSGRRYSLVSVLYPKSAQ